MSKYSARAAINENSDFISPKHFSIAVNEAIENVQESVRTSYEKAITTSKKQDMFKAVVSACAMVDGNEYGAFRIVDLQEPLSHILRKEVKLQSYQYHIGKLCQEEKGEILQKIGFPKNYRYRFKNPLLKAYVRLKLYQEEKMNE
ncbi:MAG: hypothetical protein F6J97_23145 [Leptolyngbya sp. SIO4C1]|nr:hypothetical protein [Leptolyngbya sp. SIO4C1]